MAEIRFSSALCVSYRESLERLLFFNEHQGNFMPAISASLRRFGMPRIVATGDLLRITLAGKNDAQCIYALDGCGDQAGLIGMVVFTRTDVETLSVLHLAVVKEYCFNGRNGDQVLAMRLIGKVRELARRMKGVQTLCVEYFGVRPTTIRVR